MRLDLNDFQRLKSYSIKIEIRIVDTDIDKGRDKFRKAKNITSSSSTWVFFFCSLSKLTLRNGFVETVIDKYIETKSKWRNVFVGQCIGHGLFKISPINQWKKNPIPK